MEIVDFTKCCRTYYRDGLLKQCGYPSTIKGFCDGCQHIGTTNENILLETFLGKNKNVFDQCLDLGIDSNLLYSLINGDLTFFYSFIRPVLRTGTYYIMNHVMKTDMTIFKDMIYLRIGPIDKITPKVLSFMLEKIFIVNCILEHYDRGILDVKQRFIPTINPEHLDTLYFQDILKTPFQFD